MLSNRQPNYLSNRMAPTMSFAEDPARFIASTASVSDKIRALAAAGYPRAEIARILGKRYQHVRNVLEADKAKQAGAGARPKVSGNLSDRERHFPPNASGLGSVHRLTITEDGCIVVPQALRDALGLRRGGVAIAELGEGLLTVFSSDQALRRARAMVPQWRPGEPLWSDDLIADRRREAVAEDNE